MFNVINSSITSIFTFQGLPRTPENTQGQQNVFQGSRTQLVLIANSRKVVGAQGRLATLVAHHTITKRLKWSNSIDNFKEDQQTVE